MSQSIVTLYALYGELIVALAGVLMFFVAYLILSLIIPENVGVKRVGGITFIRWGRWSFSYCKRKES